MLHTYKLMPRERDTAKPSRGSFQLSMSFMRYLVATMAETMGEEQGARDQACHRVTAVDCPLCKVLQRHRKPFCFHIGAVGLFSSRLSISLSWTYFCLQNTSSIRGHLWPCLDIFHTQKHSNKVMSDAFKRLQSQNLQHHAPAHSRSLGKVKEQHPCLSPVLFCILTSPKCTWRKDKVNGKSRRKKTRHVNTETDTNR